MPNGNAFDNAVEIARNTPGLGVGIHISLVGERCVAPAEGIPGLADDDGYLPASYGSFVKAYALRRFGSRQIRSEIEAQVAKFVQTGLRPTHIDSHQHLHAIPEIFAVVLEQARKASIPVIRVPLERRRIHPRPFGVRGFALTVLDALSKTCLQKARGQGFKVADRFWGLAASGRMDEANLLRTLEFLQPGVNEVMCHPGFGDPATRERYRWDYWWEDEANALRSEQTRRLIDAHGVRLANFADAWEQ